MPPECLYSGEKALYIEWRSGKAAAEKEQPELRGPRSGSRRPEETGKTGGGRRNTEKENRVGRPQPIGRPEGTEKSGTNRNTIAGLQNKGREFMKGMD